MEVKLNNFVEERIGGLFVVRAINAGYVKRV